VFASESLTVSTAISPVKSRRVLKKRFNSIADDCLTTKNINIDLIGESIDFGENSKRHLAVPLTTTHKSMTRTKLKSIPKN